MFSLHYIAILFTSKYCMAIGQVLHTGTLFNAASSLPLELHCVSTQQLILGLNSEIGISKKLLRNKLRFT